MNFTTEELEKILEWYHNFSLNGSAIGEDNILANKIRDFLDNDKPENLMPIRNSL